MESPSQESPPPSATTADSTVLRWCSASYDHSSSPEEMASLSSDRWEIDSDVSAGYELQRTLSGSTLLAKSSPPSTSSSPIQIAIAHLEDEFRSILASHNSPLDMDYFLVDTPHDEGQVGEKQQQVQDFDGERIIEHLHTASGTTNTSVSSRCYKSICSIREVDLISADVVHDLRLIARGMVAANCIDECVQVYANARKSAIEATLRGFNLTKFFIGDIQQLEWDALEAHIRRWRRAAKACVRIVFPSERKLCEQLFQGLDSSSSTPYLDHNNAASVDSVTGLGVVGDMCFVETVKGPAIELLNFAEVISISRRSPEKLFKILDLHDALSELFPDIQKVFESKSCDSIRKQAIEILSRLAEAARAILSEFENLVLREPSKVPIPGGTIHPLTRYVMNYVSFISDYKQTLAKLIMSKPSTGSSSGPNVPDVDLSEFEGKVHLLALHLIWIIAVLNINLEGKSKHYEDSSLTHLFMMNNAHYIVQKIKGSSELSDLIGDNILRKMTRNYRTCATEYQRATWARVLYCLSHEGLRLHVRGAYQSNATKTVLTVKLMAFYSMFEEVRRAQVAWVVPDSQLREELKISISQKLIPAYRSFLGMFGSVLKSGKHPEKYIKYSVEDLEIALLDFFEGPVSQKLS